MSSLTHAPLYDGNCMTSMAAGDGAVRVTLAPTTFGSARSSVCDFF
jgi:hypothetical protein